MENQTQETIEYLVNKRKSNFDYIKRAHQGKVHWMNVIKLSKNKIEKYTSPQKLQKRVRRWFFLGFSVGKLLELPSGANVLRALYQLMEEYDHWTDHGERSKAALPYTSFQVAKPRERKASNKEQKDDHLKANLVRINKQVVYQHFQTPYMCIRGEMDYCEVVYSLCDVMSLVYSKFLCHSCLDLQQAIFQLDKKIKVYVLSKMSQDLTAVATPLLKVQLQGLLTHMFEDVSPQERKRRSSGPAQPEKKANDVARQ